MLKTLTDEIARELSQPVAPAVHALAEAISRRHAPGSAAVLFYGSCLRRPEDQLGDGLLDFYLLVEDYASAYRKSWLAFANRLLPPNVFYIEIPWGTAGVRAKYAVMSVADFATACGRETRNVSIWARFSQPARLVWAGGEGARTRIAEACAEAVRTMIANAQPLEPAARDAETIWTNALRATYAAELRPESGDRARQIFATDRSRYERLTELVLPTLAAEMSDKAGAEAEWRRRRRIGKFLNVARLIKASFTFDGGLDYVLWKVKRHSGVTLPVSNWQRRHPLLAAPVLAWRLYRRGAFR
ncbi:MAG TPA: hypothetical protein VGM59_07150 [Dongiaceae bacterium]|jgi:hypothetical protein